MSIVVIVAVLLVVLDLAALQWGTDSRDWDGRREDGAGLWPDAGHRA